MKKLYSTIMMLAMMVAALGFTACGDDDDDDIVNGNSGSGGGKGNSAAPSLVLVKANGDKYTTLEGTIWEKQHNPNGSFTPEGTIFCLMLNEKQTAMPWLYIYPNNGASSISDFQTDMNFDNVTVYFGELINKSTKYRYASGSIKVISNNGTGFTLKLKDFKVERSSTTYLIINGTLYVENEKIW